MQKLRASIGVFWINTVCTLRCKNCITLTPYQQNPQNFLKEQIFNDIDSFFEIYEWVNHFDIEGGESLLHPDLPEIMDKAFTYRRCFERFHILTNGTVLPSERLLDACVRHKDVLWIIDDYGPTLSDKKAELESMLAQRQIAYRVDAYNGSDQYCGGWVDFGDMQQKHYTPEQLTQVFQSCRQATCGAPYIKNGRMFLCSIQGAGVAHIPLRRDEFVDFEDASLSAQEKRHIAAQLGKLPTSACAYCLGFDVEQGQRYPAAEQISGSIRKEEKICL